MSTLNLREAKNTSVDYELFEGMYERMGYLEIDGATVRRIKGKLSTKEAYEEFLESKGDIMFINYEEIDQIIGYIVLSCYDDGGARIHEMYIEKEHQCRGYGKQVIKNLIGLLKKEEIKWVELMSATIATDNFWSACNFRFTGSNDTYKYEIK